ncbi:MAG: decaprenyl-phosphate phosphoribosyltransferase [Chlorobiaceae bacterium]|nr:decaprenyl-phosphate phosphoribosyltransferase [Chlorobiaceae bacterium]
MKLLRPHQWLKNLLLLFPPFFGGKMLEADVLAALIPSFVSFSLAASSGYILNDIMDREVDKLHISKKERPIARGDISVVIAIFFAVFLLATALIVSSSVSRKFEAFLILYFFISLLYSLYFKHIAIIDIFFVSFGFLIRVLAGGEAFRVTVSSWLFLTVFVVSLFLAVAKRIGEKTIIGSEGSLHRKVLADYPPRFLEGIMWVTSSVAIVMYALYTLENNKDLIYTVPIAFFGFLRFIYITNHDGKGDPTEALLHDPQIAITGIGWLIAVAAVVYR